MSPPCSRHVTSRLDAEGHNKVALFLNADEPADKKPQTVDNSTKPDIKGKGPAKPSLAQRAAALANGAGNSDVPTEYKVTMTNRASKNLYVFGEREEEDEESGEIGHRRKRREWQGTSFPRSGSRCRHTRRSDVYARYGSPRVQLDTVTVSFVFDHHARKTATSGGTETQAQSTRC